MSTLQCCYGSSDLEAVCFTTITKTQGSCFQSLKERGMREYVVSEFLSGVTVSFSTVIGTVSPVTKGERDVWVCCFWVPIWGHFSTVIGTVSPWEQHSGTPPTGMGWASWIAESVLFTNKWWATFSTFSYCPPAQNPLLKTPQQLPNLLKMKLEMTRIPIHCMSWPWPTSPDSSHTPPCCAPHSGQSE